MYQHIVKPGETIAQIALDYRTPAQSIIQANQLIDPNRIFVGQRLTIPGFPDPTQLPYRIDVSTNRRTLTLRTQPAGEVVKVYPIAVGRILHETPVGEFIIINKAPNPGGPFGTMWMSLSKQHYGIHGTNDPASIGRAVSRGCIRMYNEDVEELARMVPISTPVFIQP